MELRRASDNTVVATANYEMGGGIESNERYAAGIQVDWSREDHPSKLWIADLRSLKVVRWIPLPARKDWPEFELVWRAGDLLELREYGKKEALYFRPRPG